MDRYAPLRRRTIALVGLMGVGKSSVGRRLASALNMPFRDADAEVEAAAGRSVSDIFTDLGEQAFRDGERRVIARLLDQEPHVLATGGGAFMNEQTRALVRSRAISVWLKTDLEVLARRVSRKDSRPLLAGKDPLEVLKAQADARYPAYAEADVIVETGDAAHHVTVDQVIRALCAHLEARAMTQTEVVVGLGARAYPVRIGPGLIDRAGEAIAPLLKRRRLAVVSDETVWALHGPRLAASLQRAGVTALPVLVAPGEQAKSFASLAEVTDRLLGLELDRGDLVAAFGGGVVGDLAGFAAAIYKRGVDFVQIPTTLLAQVDSSVGGKTAIDTPRGKNLVGAFHQPRLVLADLDVLASLPGREMRAGYAEVIKYGLLGDFGFFEWLEANGPAVVAGEPAALGEAVARSVAMKAGIVARDETEQGGRALLNLGHTFGHALEAETGYGAALLHGEAVAAGMALAFRFSAAQGLCPTQDAQRAGAAIAAAGLPTTLAELAGHPFDADRLVRHMAQDKKAEDGRLTFILARGLGSAFVAKDVDAAAVAAFLKLEGAA